MNRPTSSRWAFTLIEVLVSISVIGLLVALLVPAVLSSREAGRKVECMNRLKQIGAANFAHESTFGTFPTGFLSAGINKLGHPVAVAPLSVHYQILPFLEQTSLYNSINARLGSIEIPVATNQVNQTASRNILAVFLCPSDTGALRPGNSYRGCVGALPLEFDGNSRKGGAFIGFRQLSPRDFEDGLSQTVGFSERTIGSGRAERPDWFKDVWYSGLDHLVDNPNADQVYKGCGVPGSSMREAWSRAGETWLAGRYSDTLYNHISPPNWVGMDCSLGMPVADPGAISGGAFTARSLHRNRVNVLFMDGSVQGITSGVNLMVWRAHGTRSGRESVLTSQ